MKRALITVMFFLVVPLGCIAQNADRIDLGSQQVLGLAVLDFNGRTVFAISFYRDLYKSVDYGNHWDIVHGLPGKVNIIATDSTNHGVVFATVGADAPTYESRDAGATWFIVPAGGLPADTASSQSNFRPPNVIQVNLHDRIAFSKDDGTSWSVFKPSIPQLQPFASIWVNPHDTSSIFAGSLARGLYRSRDSGITWNEVLGAPRALSYSLFWDSNLDGTIYMLASEGSFPDLIYKSTDGGLHWTDFNSRDWPHGSIESLAMIPTKPTVLFVTIRTDSDSVPFTHTVLKSSDGGRSWTVADSASPVYSIAPAPENPGILYMPAGSGGVLRSEDGGDHWRPTAAH